MFRLFLHVPILAELLVAPGVRIHVDAYGLRVLRCEVTPGYVLVSCYSGLSPHKKQSFMEFRRTGERHDAPERYSHYRYDEKFVCTATLHNKFTPR
jgi:hypothetical protein